jgi:hypothetical protein
LAHWRHARPCRGQGHALNNNAPRPLKRVRGSQLLVIQDELRELRIPSFGAEHVTGWIVIHLDGNDQMASRYEIRVKGHLPQH